MSINTITMTCTAGTDPEFTAGNGDKTDLVTVKVYGPSKSADNASITLKAFGPKAVAIAERIHKGTRFVIQGHLESRSYANADGEKRYTVEIVADEFPELLGGGGAKTNNNDEDN